MYRSLIYEHLRNSSEKRVTFDKDLLLQSQNTWRSDSLPSFWTNFYSSEDQRQARLPRPGSELSTHQWRGEIPVPVNIPCAFPSLPSSLRGLTPTHNNTVYCGLTESPRTTQEINIIIFYLQQCSY